MYNRIMAIWLTVEQMKCTKGIEKVLKHIRETTNTPKQGKAWKHSSHTHLIYHLDSIRMKDLKTNTTIAN